MIRTLAIFIFVSLTIAQSFGQTEQYNYREIDSAAKNLSFPGSLNELAKTLTKNINQDHKKARSIFSWIAFHIKYDYEGLKDRSILKTDPEGVIKNGKSVCQGYANLFKKLCDLSGLESKVVIGWGRNSSRDIGKTNFNSPNHAWNVIKIDGSWKLIDVTWGSGNGKRKVFTQEFDDTYFFTPPEIMSLNHYPQDKKWLLGINCSKETFDNQPYYMSEYLTLNITDLNNNSGFLKPKLIGKTYFEFIYEGNIKSILVSGSGVDRKTQNIQFKQENDKVSFKFKIKKKSPRYTIYLNNIGIIEYKTTTKKS
jgi:hypothetical protein